MDKIKFEKVSFEQFKKDVNTHIGLLANKENKIKEAYDNIQLPKRATKGSAGYDIIMPFDILVSKSDTTVIPTGIRAIMPQNVVLLLAPRSGQGFKYGLRLVNTVGVIDSDYAFSDNEGHIMLKITHNLGNYLLRLEQGKGFAQGIFVNYCTTEDDNVEAARNGGFGSTDEQNNVNNERR